MNIYYNYLQVFKPNSYTQVFLLYKMPKDNENQQLAHFSVYMNVVPEKWIILFFNYDCIAVLIVKWNKDYKKNYKSKYVYPVSYYSRVSQLLPTVYFAVLYFWYSD